MFGKRWWPLGSSWCDNFGLFKALVSHDENLKKNLKKDKLTTRDSRVVERKKYGHRKAAEEAFNFQNVNHLNLLILFLM